MKKFVLAIVIFFLVLSTAIIKNTTKQIEDEIFAVKENIRVLNSEFGNVSLEYDYLSSSERLLEFQSQYFEDELIQKNINDIRVYNTSNDVNKIKNFKKELLALCNDSSVFFKFNNLQNTSDQRYFYSWLYEDN